MCKTKFLQLCLFSIIFTSLHSLNSSFQCFPIWFLLLYLSFHLDSLHRHPDFPHFRISSKIPDQDFKKIATFVQKRKLRFVITA